MFHRQDSGAQAPQQPPQPNDIPDLQLLSSSRTRQAGNMDWDKIQPKSRIVEVTCCCPPVKTYRSQVGLWKNLIKAHAVHAKKKKRRRKERQICIKPHGQCSEVNIADSKEDDFKEGEETACGMRIGTFVFTVERRDNGQKNCQRNSNFARLMEPRRGWRRGRNQQR